MIITIYAYLDEKTGAFGNPQYTPMDEKMMLTMAKRTAMSGDAEQLRYATLYKLGYFDDEAGTFRNDKKEIANLGELVGVKRGTKNGNTQD